MKCTYCGQDGHFTIKYFKTPQGERYKGKPENPTGGKNRQFSDANAAEAEQLKKLKACSEVQDKDGYNPPLSTKVNNAELGFKNRKIIFSDEVEKYSIC